MLLTVALIAMIPALVFWKLFRTIFNPVTLFCASISVTVGIACLVDSYSEFNLVYGKFRVGSDPVAFLYVLGLTIFLIPWLPYGKQIVLFGSNYKSVTDIYGFKAWTFFWASITFLGIIYIIYVLGGIPIVRMIFGGYTIVDHIEALPNLPLGLMTAYLAPATILCLHLASIAIFKKQYKFYFKETALLMILIVFAATFQGNRQLILIALFFVVARVQLSKVGYSRKSLRAFIRDTVKYTILITLFVASFITISTVRHPEIVDIQWFEIFGYFSWPVFNVGAILESGYFNISDTPHFILSEIIPKRLLDAEHTLELKSVLFEPTSPSGYLAYWFIDFGYVGVSIGVFLLSGVCRLAHQWRNCGEFNMRVYILCLWCCATAGIYSHFITINYFWIPLSLLYFEKCFSRRQQYAYRDTERQKGTISH